MRLGARLVLTALRRPMSSPIPESKRPRAASPAASTSAAPLSVAEASTAEASTAAAAAALKPKAPKPNMQIKGKRKRGMRKLPDPYSAGDILYHDVVDFLGKAYTDEVIARGDGSEWEAPEGLEKMSVVELTPGAISVSGESLSLYEENGRKWAIVTPFAHPGDTIKAKIIRHERFATHADLVDITSYSETLRGGEGDRRLNPNAGCKYFGTCGGCQFQPIPYPQQLLHKQRTVDLAYQRFSGLSTASVPTILPTIGSPQQWAYRTKITPHFDAAPKWVKALVGEEAAMNETADVGRDTFTDEAGRNWSLRIGFERKGKPGVLDIEECPIATTVINERLTEERERVRNTIMNYKRGATILLRDSQPAPEPLPTAESPFDPATVSDVPHVAITDHKAQVYERVGQFLFSFAAGSFFQNNNSILVPLTEYVKEAIFPPGSSAKRPTHLVDTYCGSGLFGITLSPEFERVAGVEISADSIAAAKKNAAMNGLQDKTTWLCGKAEDIFGGLPEQGFAGSHSCVVIDPPRKGCDEPFLAQLLEFRPLTAVYVSCNVHTQARDIGWFVDESRRRGAGKWWYEVESLRGFDLFPQTAHVESVGVLRLIEV